MKKRIFSTFLCAAILLSYVSAAAADGEFDTSVTAGWQYNFTRLTDDTKMGGMNYFGLDGNSHIYAKDGYGSKSMNDTSAVMYTSGGSAGAGLGQALGAYTPGSQYAFHMSFDWLIGDYTCSKNLIIKMNGTKSYWDFMHVKPDGNIYFRTNSLISANQKAELGQWHKYDLYFYYGTTRVDAYKDGTLFKQITCDVTINYIQEYRFTQVATSDGSGGYYPAVQALDNIFPTIEKIDTLALPTPVYNPRIYGFDRILSNTANYSTQMNTATTTVSGVAGNSINYANFKTIDGTPTGGLTSFDVIDGVFGKEKSDKVLHLSNPNGYFQMANQYAHDTVVELYPNDRGGMPYFPKNSGFRYSVSVAFDEFSDNSVKNIYAKMNGARYVNNFLLTVSNSGSTVKTFGQTLAGVTFAKNTWYRLDYAFYVGDDSDSANIKPNRVDVYLDGQKLFNEPLVYYVDSGSTAAMTSIILYNALCPTKTGNKDVNGYEEFLNDSVYFDDITLDYKTNPADLWNGNAAMTHTNPMISQNIAGAVIKNAANITVNDFLSGAAVANGEVMVRNGNGESITSGSLYTSKIAVYPEYGGEIFFKTTRINKDLYIVYNDFDDEPPAYTPFVMSKIGGSYIWNSADFKGGAGGKQTDDKSLIIDVAGHAGQTVNGDAGNDPFMNYVFSTPYTLTKDFVYESDILGPTEGGSVHMCIALNDNTIRSVVVFDANKNILFNNEIVGKWDTNRWYKCAVVFKKDSATADFYLNGRLICASMVINGITSINTVNRLKLAFCAPEKETGMVSTGGFDSIQLYEGTYSLAGSLPLVTGEVVSGADRLIFINSQMDYAAFTSKCTVSGNYKIYKDNNLEEEASTIINGCVLRVFSESGNIIEYYTFADISGAPRVGSISAACAGKTIMKSQSGIVTVSAQAGTNGDPVILIAAVYENGKLVRLAQTSTTQTGVLSAAIQVDNGTKQSVKAMAIGGYAKLTPLCSALSLPVSETAAIEGVTTFYPGFVTKALTLSYDDSYSAMDITLMEHLSGSGLGCTFNFNSGSSRLKWMPAEEQANIAAKYSGYEVVNHSFMHLRMYDESTVTLTACEEDIATGRSDLEGIFGKPVKGLAWPYGKPNARSDYNALLDYIKGTGVLYIRNASSSGNFNLPTDWYDWTPTCHQSQLTTYLPQFLSLDTKGELKLFYVWGHTFEFSPDSHGNFAIQDWSLIDNMVNDVKDRDDIWFANNMEIYNYIKAVNSIVKTQSTIENPSATDVYLQVNGINVCIPAYESYTLN